jgi:tetratricopeptide (TPR) repeat protein
MTGQRNVDAEYDALCRILSEPVVRAAECCAVPHSVDDSLGYKIVHEFAKLNGTASTVWAEVKGLPFVYPLERDQWRFVDSARSYFTARLEERNDDHLELNRFLTNHYEQEQRSIPDKDSPRARELEWLVAYHLAPVAPRECVTRLTAFGEQSLQASRVADVKAVLDLFKEQHRWLSAYDLEQTYFEGRYAYSKGEYPTAESRFNVVWETAGPNQMKAISSHLLGMIWMSRSAKDGLSRAEQLFRESLQIGRDLNLKHHIAMVLNSLGSVLVKLGDRKTEEEIEALFQESLQIGRDLNLKHHIGAVLNSLGSVLAKWGGDAGAKQAEGLFRESLQIFQDIGDRGGEAKVLNSLSSLLVRFGDRKSEEEAEALCRKNLQIVRSIGDRPGEAILNSLLARLSESRGDFSQACEQLEQVISINEELGITRFADKNIEWLNSLRSKLP